MKQNFKYNRPNFEIGVTAAINIIALKIVSNFVTKIELMLERTIKKLWSYKEIKGLF